jgi:hypothetical protein
VFYNLDSPISRGIVQAGLVDQVSGIQLAALGHKPVHHGDGLVFIFNQHGRKECILLQGVVA